MSPAERNAHVLELIDDAGAMLALEDDIETGEPRPVGVSYVDAPFEGAPKARIVLVSHEPGSSAVAYLVALHEIGHLHNDCVEDQNAEARAWRWAIANSRECIDADLWGEIAWRLRSYTNPEFEGLLQEAERMATK